MFHAFTCTSREHVICHYLFVFPTAIRDSTLLILSLFLSHTHTHTHAPHTQTQMHIHTAEGLEASVGTHAEERGEEAGATARVNHRYIL